MDCDYSLLLLRVGYVLFILDIAVSKFIGKPADTADCSRVKSQK